MQLQIHEAQEDTAQKESLRRHTEALLQLLAQRLQDTALLESEIDRLFAQLREDKK